MNVKIRLLPDATSRNSLIFFQIFKYDAEDVQQHQQDEPVSPALSQSPAFVLYSNLNSPVPVLNMPPPAVNRDLKPKRKLSDSHSISSNPEPSSPRSATAAPTIDRKLKPPTSIPVSRSLHLSYSL